MRKLVILIFTLLSGAALAQTPDPPTLGDQPIEITSTGGTNYENGIATARDNVSIRLADADIYADAGRVQFHHESHHPRGQRPHLPRRGALRGR
jgi:hypothetical protein